MPSAAWARGNVLEQHRDRAVLERTYAERRQLEQPTGRGQFLLEPDPLAGAQHRTVARNPGLGLVRHHLAQSRADNVRDTGVRFDMDVVVQGTVRPVEEFDDAEALVHQVEELSEQRAA